jgi:AcrR family transcriptional regulator
MTTGTRAGHGRGGRPAQLSGAQITAAAIDLIDDDGLDALTMRALGARLGVAAMSLYRHLPNRDAVLAAVVDRLFATALDGFEPGGSWPEALTRFAAAYRRMLLDHPHAAPLLATHPVDVSAALPLVAGILDRFAAAGVGEDDATVALQSVGVYVLGHALAQTGTPPGTAPAAEPDRAALAWYDGWFEAGLGALVDGFRQRLTVNPPPAP